MGGRLDKWDSTCSRSKAAADINQRLHSIFRKTFSLFLKYSYVLRYLNSGRCFVILPLYTTNEVDHTVKM